MDDNVPEERELGRPSHEGRGLKLVAVRDLEGREGCRPSHEGRGLK